MRTLIYRNDRMIDLYKYCYSRGIADIQAIIDNLSKEGIPLNDESLSDLCNGGSKTKETTQKQIDEELAKTKFQVLRDEIKKSTEVLPYRIDEAADKIRRARSVSSGNQSVYIDLAHLAVKDLKITLVSDFEHIITEKFSIYADSPEMTEAHERALRLEREINDYFDFLRVQGDFLRPIGQRGFADYGVIGIDKDGKAYLQPESFQALFSKVRKSE